VSEKRRQRRSRKTKKKQNQDEEKSSKRVALGVEIESVLVAPIVGCVPSRTPKIRCDQQHARILHLPLASVDH
jgi:hypothetical protein